MTNYLIVVIHQWKILKIKKHWIKKNRFREPYPSLVEYPYQIPTHHTVINLDKTEQQELQEWIEAKTKQEQE